MISNEGQFVFSSQNGKNNISKKTPFGLLFYLYANTRQLVKHPILDSIFRSKPVTAIFVRFRMKTINNAREEMLANNYMAGLFSYVEIETLNRCNGVCSFCPVNKNADTRKYAKMNDELFEKIISELQEIKYKGLISLHSNNEPFLDNRMESFIEKARRALPKAYLNVYTNATLLTLERFKKVIDNLDMLVIDNYSDERKMIPNVKAIDEYCKDKPELRKKVRITFIKTNIVRNTRAGQSPNNKRRVVYPTSCFLPWNQLVIRPDGKISLCCQDALGKSTLGDISEQTILEAWNSEAYKVVRNKLLADGRKSFETCKYCDYFGHMGIVKPLDKSEGELS